MNRHHQLSVMSLTLYVFIGCTTGSRVVQSPAPMTATVTDGEQLIAQERYEDAADVFEALLKDNPTDAKIHYYLGLCHASLGDHAAAIPRYQAAIAADENFVEALTNLGLLYLSVDQADAARPLLERAAVLEPDAGDTHFNLALALEETGDIDGAIAALNASAERAPSDPDPLIALGDIRRRQLLHQDALEYYDAAISADPADAIAVLAKGELLLDMDRPQDASLTLRALTTMDSADARILTSGALLLSKAGQMEDAISLGRASLERDSDFVTTHLILARALFNTGDKTGAARHFQFIIDTFPESKEADSAREGLKKASRDEHKKDRTTATD